ncbi:unnamed protein product [Ectocarpus sp. 8 AP-2014]
MFVAGSRCSLQSYRVRAYVLLRSVLAYLRPRFRCWEPCRRQLATQASFCLFEGTAQSVGDWLQGTVVFRCRVARTANREGQTTAYPVWWRERRTAVVCLKRVQTSTRSRDGEREKVYVRMYRVSLAR